MTNHFLWCVEHACWTAWPSAESKEVEGWVFRSSGGETKRTNSVNATAAARSVQEVLSAAAGHYAKRGMPLLFRTLSFQPEFEEELAAYGFLPEGKTCTLQADLSDETTSLNPFLESHSKPSEEWVADKLRLTPMSAGQERAYRTMLASLKVPVRFARITHDGVGVSLAYGAIVDGILIIESVVTDPDQRGKGLARDVVGALMAWGQTQGAEVSCLQVMSDNAPGHALYRKLGFGAELYRYQYWRRPAVV
jgi:N-acetylglutamate synthase